MLYLAGPRMYLPLMLERLAFHYHFPFPIIYSMQHIYGNTYTTNGCVHKHISLAPMLAIVEISDTKGPKCISCAHTHESDYSDLSLLYSSIEYELGLTPL